MKRIPSLDGLRAISIFLVVLGHLAVRGHAPSFWLYYPNIGVRMFFVISGYLITSILLREQSQSGTVNLTQFYVRRAFRIFPAAFVFMAILTLVYWPELRWFQILTAALYVANFSLSHQSWVFGHLWSLSVEEQFYFLWPAVLKRFQAHKIAILIWVIGLSPLYQACLYYLKVHDGGYGSLPSVANNVAVGCLTAILAMRIREIPAKLALAMFALVALIPLFPGNTPVRTLALLFVLQPILHFSMAGLIIHVTQHPYRILNWRPIVWLGQLSYSLYLWQQPFCYAPWSKSAFAIVPSLVCACLSFYCVERPFLRLRDKKSLRWKAKPIRSYTEVTAA